MRLKCNSLYKRCIRFQKLFVCRLITCQDNIVTQVFDHANSYKTFMRSNILNKIFNFFVVLSRILIVSSNIIEKKD